MVYGKVHVATNIIMTLNQLNFLWSHFLVCNAGVDFAEQLV